ncbi:MAG: 3-isopropylmalate dehydratase large subunit [Peptococcaceae bacterium]|nr:3-isopropylmalate dehydratase large subunit [Peptococcaceae bacterium]
MGKTIAEKIMSRASGKDVSAGDLVTAKVDLHYNLETGIADIHKRLIQAGLPDGLPAVADPDRLAVMIGDHEGCHGKPKDAAAYKLSRELAERYGIRKVYDINTGVAHAAVTEEGLVRPGMLVCAKDSHTTTCGGVNALGIPVSEVETAWIYATGELWFRAPESVKIICGGTLQAGVVSKDIFLAVIGKYTPSMAQYKSVEWGGEIIDRMGMDGRLTLSCQAIELGAKCSPFEPDQTCLEYVAGTPRGNEPYQPAPADRDAVYERVYEEDFSDLEPQVALPHGFGTVKPVSEAAGVDIHQCNLGSCANGRFDDLEIFAEIVKGRRVKARTIFSPATWKIYTRAAKSGILATLAEAGVMIQAPSCLDCGGRGSCIADGEVAMGATTRNFLGRFGAPKSDVYLASPATLAASAVMGKIADPRDFI